MKSCDLQDFFQNAQKKEAIVSNTYYATAIDEKSRKNEILNNPALSNPQKEIKYEQAVGNYSQYTKKAVPIATAVYPLLNKSAPSHKSSATITRAKQFPFPDGEAEHGPMEDILNLPYEPAKKDDATSARIILKSYSICLLYLIKTMMITVEMMNT